MQKNRALRKKTSSIRELKLWWYLREAAWNGDSDNCVEASRQRDDANDDSTCFVDVLDSTVWPQGQNLECYQIHLRAQYLLEIFVFVVSLLAIVVFGVQVVEGPHQKFLGLLPTTMPLQLLGQERKQKVSALPWSTRPRIHNNWIIARWIQMKLKIDTVVTSKVGRGCKNMFIDNSLSIYRFLEKKSRLFCLRRRGNRVFDKVDSVGPCQPETSPHCNSTISR